MKRILALFMAVVLAVGFLPSAAFAAEGESPMVITTADKTNIKPGEMLTITYSIDHDLEYMTRLDLVLRFDATLFQFVSADTEGSVWFTKSGLGSVITQNNESFVRVKQNRNSNEDTISAGKICSITFMALDSISNASTAAFYNSGSSNLYSSSIMVDEDYCYVEDGAFDHGADDPIQVTIAPDGTGPIPTATGYSVSMGADQQTVAGQKVRIPVTVASSEKGITGFNAYDMTFTYDPAALTLNTTSDSAANLTVEDNNGTVRVRRYGDTVALGEALALEFTANKATSSTVTLTTAKFDLDANSINFDAPDATITDADTTVKALWNVSLPDGFVSAAADGSTLVENGADFTFKAVDPNYEYTLNITTNGQTQEVTVKGGSYTIENVTDNVQVTVVSKVGRTYTLKFVGSGVDAGLVTPTTATVQYPNDYDFTVKFPGTGYKTTVSFAPSANKFDVERLENGDYAYKLLGNYLVGDENGEIIVTVEKVENTAKKDIIVAGSGSEAFSADNALTFYAGENYTFKLDKNEQYYDYELVVWYTDSSNHTVRPTPKDNGDGTYTIVNMPNADMHITIHKMAKALDPDAVDVVKYLELDNKTMYMVTVWGELSHTNLGSTNTTYIAYTYDDNLMYDTSYYTAPNGTKGASSWLVIVDKGEEFTKEEALKHLKLVDSTEEQNKSLSLVYFGIDPNVNGSKGGQLDINDVQLVYDMYNGLYESFEQVSVKKFLLADQTLDRQLNSADAVKLADKLGY